MIKLSGIAKPFIQEAGVADDDAKAAKEIKGQLNKSLADIARSMDLIHKSLSSFNSPGLKTAFTDALRIALKRQGKFDERAAYKRFEDYYKGR